MNAPLPPPGPLDPRNTMLAPPMSTVRQQVGDPEPPARAPARRRPWWVWAASAGGALMAIPVVIFSIAFTAGLIGGIFGSHTSEFEDLWENGSDTERFLVCATVWAGDDYEAGQASLVDDILEETDWSRDKAEDFADWIVDDHVCVDGYADD